MLPPRIKKGQTIGIFSSSSPIVSRDAANRAYKYIENMGFKVYEHPQCKLSTGHTAGTITQRVQAIHNLIADPSIGALMAFWGGANTNQILPYLDYYLIKKNPKVIIGFSDTSALTLAITKLTGLVTFMGPAAITYSKPEPFNYSWNYFSEICINGNNVITKDSPTYADDLFFLRKDSNHRILQKNSGRKVYHHGRVKGEVVAANLQTLMVLAGTRFFPKLENKILFIEESEDTKKSMVHRFFTHLGQAVRVNKLKGVVIGRFCSQTGFDNTDSVKNMLQDVFPEVSIPILYNLDFGHSDPLFTIPNGGIASIDTRKNIITFNKAVR